MMPAGLGSPTVAIHIIADSSKYLKSIFRMQTLTQKVGTSMVASLAIATAATLGLATAAARVGQEFELQLKLTSVVAGATAEQFKMLERRARELGRTTAYTSAQAAQGMYGFASAGFKAKEIVEAIGHSLHLAGAFAFDMAETTNMVASAIRMFGYETTQTQRIVDAYTQGITSSLLTMEKLSSGMSYAGPVAAGFRMTIEETVLALAQFANIGLEGTRIGVAFRMMMKSASKSTYEKVKALKKYNMTMADVNPATQKFIGIIRAVADANMTVSDSMKVFGARVGAYVVAIANMVKSGVLQWDEELKEYVSAIGNTEKIYMEMMGTFKMELIKVKSVMQDLMIAIFQKYKGEVTDFFEVLRTNINKLTREIEIHGGMIKDVAETLSIWGSVLSHLIPLLGDFFALLYDLGISLAIGKVLSTIFTWGVALKAATVAAGSFSAAMGLVVGSIKAAGLAAIPIAGWAGIITAVVAVLGTLIFQYQRTKEEIIEVNMAWREMILEINKTRGNNMLEEMNMQMSEFQATMQILGRDVDHFFKAENEGLESVVTSYDRIHKSAEENMKAELKNFKEIKSTWQERMDFHKEEASTIKEKMALQLLQVGYAEDLAQAQRVVNDVIEQRAKGLKSGEYGDITKVDLPGVGGDLGPEGERLLKRHDYINRLLEKQVETNKEIIDLEVEKGQIKVSQKEHEQSILNMIQDQIQAITSLELEKYGEKLKMLDLFDVEKGTEYWFEANEGIQNYYRVFKQLSDEVEDGMYFDDAYDIRLDFDEEHLEKELEALFARVEDETGEKLQDFMVVASYEKFISKMGESAATAAKKEIRKIEKEMAKLGETSIDIRIKSEETFGRWQRIKFAELWDAYTNEAKKATATEVELFKMGVEEKVEAWKKKFKDIGLELSEKEIADFRGELISGEAIARVKEFSETLEELQVIIEQAGMSDYEKSIDDVAIKYGKLQLEQEKLIKFHKENSKEYKELMEQRAIIDKAYIVEKEKLEADHAKELQETRKEIADELYKTTHTELENEIKAIEDKRDEYIKILGDEVLAKQLAEAQKVKLMKEYFKEIEEEFDSVNDTIATAGMEEFEKSLYELEKERADREKEFNEKHKKELTKTLDGWMKYYDYLRKIDEAYAIDKAELFTEAYNEQVEDWNDAVDSMKDTFKDIFIQSMSSEWKGWSEYWEDVLDRLRNTFLDFVLTLISDWAFGLLKMETMSQAAGLLNFGASTVTSMAGTVAGGGAAGGLSGLSGMGSTIMTQGGMMILSKPTAAKVAAGLVAKLPGLGGMLTTNAVSGSTAYAAGIQGPVMASGQFSAAGGPTTFVPGVGMVALGGAAGGIIGGLVGTNYAQTHGKDAGIAMGAGVGMAGGGIAGGVLAGMQAGGIGGPLGAIIGAVVGLIVGTLSTAFGADPVKRKRQKRAEVTLGAFSSLASDDFTSMQNMMAAMPAMALDPKAMYGAMEYKNLPDSNYWYLMQEGMGILKDTMEEIGSLSPNVGNAIDMTADSLDILFQQMEHLDPELAKGIKGLQDNLKKTFSNELIKNISRGVVSLSNARDQLQDLGLEDAEMAAKLFESSIASLFSETFPKGEIQLERMYNELKDLQDTMQEAEQEAKGLETAQKLLASGIEFTNQELELLVKNADNLRRMEWINVYDAMGLDEIYLAAPAIESTEDAIEEMRASLSRADASLESFVAVLQTMPNSMAEVRYQLGGVALYLEAVIDASNSLVNVVEDISKLEEVFEGLVKAVKAGDWGAVADDISTLSKTFSDSAQALQQFSVVINAFGQALAYWGDMNRKMDDALGDRDIEKYMELEKRSQGLVGWINLAVASFGNLASIFGRILSIGAQAIYAIVLPIMQLTQITYLGMAAINALRGSFWDLIDAMNSTDAGPMPWLEDIKEDRYQRGVDKITNSLSMWVKLAEFFNATKLLQFIEVLKDIRLGNWNKIFNKEELEDTYTSFEDFFYRINELSTETFLSMTEDIWSWNKASEMSAGAISGEALGRELSTYLQYLLANADEINTMLAGTNENVESFIDMAFDFYEDKLDELIESATKAWEDFSNSLINEMGELDSQIAKQNRIIAGGSDEIADYNYYVSEMARNTDLANEALDEFNALMADDTATSEERLSKAQEYQDYLRSALDSQINAITAYYDEEERLIREKYETEKEMITELTDYMDRYDAFKKGIKDLQMEVMGSGLNKAAGFNVARREVERIKTALETATGGDALDLYEELKDAYDKLWSEGSGIYDEDTQAYKLLQQEVLDGLADLLTEGGEAFESEIDILKGQLEGIEDIADSTSNMEAELEELRIREARQIKEAIEDYQTALGGLQVVVGGEVENITEDIAGAFYTALTDFVNWYETIDPGNVYLDRIDQNIQEIRDEYLGGTAPVPDPQGEYGIPGDASAEWREISGIIDNEWEVLSALGGVFSDLPFDEQSGADQTVLAALADQLESAMDMGSHINLLTDPNAGGLMRNYAGRIDQDELSAIWETLGTLSNYWPGETALQHWIDLLDYDPRIAEHMDAALLEWWRDLLPDPPTDPTDPPPPGTGADYYGMPSTTVYGDALANEWTSGITGAIDDVGGYGKQEIGAALAGMFADLDWMQLTGGAGVEDSERDMIFQLGTRLIDVLDLQGVGVADLMADTSGARSAMINAMQQGEITTINELNQLLGVLNNTVPYTGGQSMAEYFLEDLLGYSSSIWDDMLAQFNNWYDELASAQTGGYINRSGIVKLHSGEVVLSPESGSPYGLDGLASSLYDRMGDGMVHIPRGDDGYTNPDWEPGVMPIPDTKTERERVFVFVPYNTSPAEQERIYQDVKGRITEDSENEQFIYDTAIIQTNRGI
jgi:TP901 family phage tail tape measure protein